MPKYSNGPLILRFCPICTAPVAARPSEAARGSKVFCSKACLYVRRAQPRSTLAERFWPKVNKDGPTPTLYPELGPCWLWCGLRQSNGYGKIHLGGRKIGKIYAHRAAWILANGQIPDGMEVCHACDGGPLGCVRPKHLFLGTHAENMQDYQRKRLMRRSER